ncbi:hypothetical protein, partial [Enterococcus faecium]
MNSQISAKSKYFCLVMSLLMTVSILFSAEGTVLALENTSNDTFIERINNFEEDTNSGNYAKNLKDLSDLELNEFEQKISEEVDKLNLSTEKEKEAYYQAFWDLFDPTSETYGNLNSAAKKLNKELNPSSRYKRAAHGWISVSFAGAAFNLGVNLATGGVASAGVKALIRKYGTQKAINLINRRIVGIVATWGIKQATGINIITGAVASAIKTALDPGTS